MGEAKRNRLRHARLITNESVCVYCGGKDQLTVEHMPPIALFRKRDRPHGLVFPACKPCNNGTGRSDLVAALMARVHTDSMSSVALPETERLLKAVSNNVPGLLQEMQLGRAAQKLASRGIPNFPPGAGLLRANGPILSQHMLAFGAKLGFALHFELHGKRVPNAGGVLPMYFTNVSALKGELPKEIFTFLPEPLTLRQGTKHVSDQFEYAYAATEEKRHTITFATFNKSFSIFVTTALDRSEFLERHSDRYRVWTPGEFRAAIA